MDNHRFNTLECYADEEQDMNDTYKIELGSFADYIKEEWMEPLGLTKYKLANDLGISPAAIGKFLAGRNNLSNDTCWRLVRYFGTSPDFFINMQAGYEFRNNSDLFLKETESLPVYNWG